MQFVNLVVEMFLHLDKTLPMIVDQYHNLVYVLLFIVIFCETGLVVTPFLPGDSLIFATATLVSIGKINPFIILPLFYIASIGGDNTNYNIGRFLSNKVKNRQKIRFVKTENIDRTHAFYEKHGGATVIIAKFMPIIRTFSPFVAGVGAMTYRRFVVFDIIGGLMWVSLFFVFGLLFGRIPVVQEHFSFVVLGIIAISLIPAVVIFLKDKLSSKKTKN